MSLSKVQQTKIRAALAWVRDKHGPEDVQQLIGMAHQMRAQGAPERAAWNYAMDQLHNADPDLSEKIAQSFNLLDASDTATLERYDGALAKYVDEGDQAALLDMRPEIARDDATLDFQNGALSKQELDARLAEIDAGNIARQEPQQGNEQQQQGSQKWERTEQSAVPQIGDAPPPVGSALNSSQVSFSDGPTGTVAAKAAQLWARDAAAREAVHGAANGGGAASL